MVSFFIENRLNLSINLLGKLPIEYHSIDCHLTASLFYVNDAIKKWIDFMERQCKGVFR